MRKKPFRVTVKMTVSHRGVFFNTNNYNLSYFMIKSAISTATATACLLTDDWEVSKSHLTPGSGNIKEKYAGKEATTNLRVIQQVYIPSSNFPKQTSKTNILNHLLIFRSCPAS